jgi:hypothetical protein
MPYESDAQRRFFHSAGARKAGLTAENVAEWDAASKGQRDVPERVKVNGTSLRARLRAAVAARVGR